MLPMIYGMGISEVAEVVVVTCRSAFRAERAVSAQRETDGCRFGWATNGWRRVPVCCLFSFFELSG